MRTSRLVLLLSCLASGFSTTIAESYLWPLDAPPALTSTYAEYRFGRFHAGLDVKTWGKEGYPCVAVADGYVWRVRTSPWGYGKAIYLKLEDGRTAVYAHLAAFEERVEKVVSAEQDRRGGYSVNLFLPPGQIPVKRGDVVAFSGSTGSGYPHLHFEIRDRQQRPMNPLVNGFGVKDTIEPTLLELAFIPLDAEARVDGRNVPIHRVLRWEQGKGFFGQPVSLWGRVGVAVKVYDRADASALTNKLAPYRLALSVGNDRLFMSTYQLFSYDRQVYEVDLDRNFGLTRKGKKGFHNLFLLPGNTLPLYDGLPIGSGVIDAGLELPGAGTTMEIGTHPLTVMAEDALGNRAVAHVEIQVRRPVYLRDVAIEPESGSISGRFSRAIEAQSLVVEGSTDGKRWEWLKTARVRGDGFSVDASGSFDFLRVRFADGPSAILSTASGESEAGASPSVETSLGQGRTHVSITSTSPMVAPPLVERDDGVLDVIAVDAYRYEAVVATDPDRPYVSVRVANVDGGSLDTTLVVESSSVRPTRSRIQSDDGVVSATFDAGSVYWPFYARIERTKLPDGAEPPIGHAYRLEPDSVPFRSLVPVHFKVPEGEDRLKLGLYEWTTKGWAFVWNDVDSTRNTVGAGVRHFSVYALLRDDVPPEVSIRKPADGSRTARNPEIEVALKDNLSGIPMEELIDFELNGKTVVFEYDPEGDVARGLLRQDLSTGAHELVVRVRDTNGNESVATSRFIVE